MAQKKGLGRGLNDLLGTSEASKPSRSRNNQQNSSENTSKEVKTVTKEVVKEVVKEVEQKIKINLIEPNKSQPRKQFDEEALQELSDSIKNYGVLEPLIVTKKGDYYEIIAGERRLFRRLTGGICLGSVYRLADRWRAVERELGVHCVRRSR